MSKVVDERVRSVLEAMRSFLGFSSIVFARLDADRGGLVLSFVIGERVAFLREAVKVLGFDPTGAVFPLWAKETVFIRCYRNGRIISTTDLQDLVRGALPLDTLASIAMATGPRLYVCVPVPGASGAILAVVMLDRAKIDPLTSDERDQLLLYAARLGQLIEADRLGAPPVDSGQDSPTTRWLSIYLLDRSLRTLWAGGRGPGAPSVLSALDHDVKPGQCEVTLSDGTTLAVNIYAVDPTGEVAWLLLCENLAQRDREVRELREQLRLRLARIRETVVGVDDSLRITACNDAVRHVFGAEPAEMIGRSIRVLMPDGRFRPSHEKLADKLMKRGHVDGQLRLQRRDGSRFPAEISVLLLVDENEEPSGAIATIRDLSEQKRQAAERRGLQKQVLRSERLAALGEMAARIAHEVRNPLAAIGAAALSIEEDDEGGRNARKQASAIGAEVRRLETILNDLLQFARPRPVAPEKFDLSDFVRESIAVARADPQSEGIEIVLKSECSIGTRVKGDIVSLRQVMMNVLRNALEACTPKGTITCRVSEKNGIALVEVSDTGSGLSRAVRRRAFEPFFSTKSRGTGLGLPISRQIMEEHGGELTLGSRRGGGARATLKLKVSDELHRDEQ